MFNEKLNKDITALQRKMRTEKQFNRQVELYGDMNWIDKI